MPPKLRSKNQYFEDFIDYGSLDMFVDVGTFTGDTVLEFEKYNTNPNCEIVAFEMDDELYKIADSNLKKINKKISLIKKAVSNKDGICTLKASLGSMQSITNDTFDNIEKEEMNGISFETITLDSHFSDRIDELSNKKILLKMDIEGAEMEALSGMTNFIKKTHPTIAVCVYHKADDLFNISDFISKCDSSYQFRLRHYSDNQTETVLFAI